VPSHGPKGHSRGRRCLVIGLRPMGGPGALWASLPYGYRAARRSTPCRNSSTCQTA
jgi:hypothetical protein